MEREADKDKDAGRIIGDGTVEGLMKELKLRTVGNHDEALRSP